MLYLLSGGAPWVLLLVVALPAIALLAAAAGRHWREIGAGIAGIGAVGFLGWLAWWMLSHPNTAGWGVLFVLALVLVFVLDLRATKPRAD
jgi:hypothetical protein